MHDDVYIGRRSEYKIKCVVHDDLGPRAEEPNNSIYSVSLALRVIFSSFIFVEVIQFFHGALQL